MKRAMTGGSHRGAPALRRQRRTIRLVQGLLVVIAAALLIAAGFALGQRHGYEAGRAATELGAPRPPSGAQVVVMAVLGLGAFGAALLLQERGGVRLPTPARLDELAGRAETAAIERAEASPPERGESATSR